MPRQCTNTSSMAGPQLYKGLPRTKDWSVFGTDLLPSLGHDPRQLSLEGWFDLRHRFPEYWFPAAVIYVLWPPRGAKTLWSGRLPARINFPESLNVPAMSIAVLTLKRYANTGFGKVRRPAQCNTDTCGLQAWNWSARAQSSNPKSLGGVDFISYSTLLLTTKWSFQVAPNRCLENCRCWSDFFQAMVNR